MTVDAMKMVNVIQNDFTIEVQLNRFLFIKSTITKRTELPVRVVQIDQINHSMCDECMYPR